MKVLEKISLGLFGSSKDLARITKINDADVGKRVVAKLIVKRDKSTLAITFGYSCPSPFQMG